MTDAGYEALDDPYSYRGTAVLKNRAHLRDPDLLEAFELEMTALRAEEPLPAGRFDAVHYRAIHRHIFGDVYAWAGRYRTVRTAKPNATFCFPEHIERSMDALFRRLAGPPFTGGGRPEAFDAAAADFLAELNAIHPFREGNGRTQLIFLHLVAVRAGHPIDARRVRRATFLPAMIASFAGDLRALTGEIARLRL